MPISHVARFTHDIDHRETCPRTADETAANGPAYDLLRHTGLTTETVTRAFEIARRLNVEPHEVLLSCGAITPQHYVEALAAHLDIAALRPGRPPLASTDIFSTGPGWDRLASLV